MKLFVDTGDVAEVKRAAEWGFLDGVTTNPTLIAKSGKGFRETVLAICEAVPVKQRSMSLLDKPMASKTCAPRSA